MAASNLRGDSDGSESGNIITQAQSRSVANISNGQRVGMSVDIANGKMKKVRQKCSESRKIRKPLMEKKRRARINHSLNELKRILLEANGAPTLSKEGNRPTKLEKADILELTVTFLQALQEQQPTPTSLNSNLGAPVISSSLAEVAVTATANVSSTSSSDLEMDMDMDTDGGSQSGQEKQALPAVHRKFKLLDQNLSNSFGLTTSDSSFTNGFTKCTKLVESDLHKNLRPPKSPKSRKRNQHLQLKLGSLLQQHLEDLVIPQSKSSDSGVGRIGSIKEENNNEQPELPINGSHDDTSVNAYLVPTRLANGTLVFAVKCHHALGHGLGCTGEGESVRACENLHSGFCLTEAEPYHYPTQNQNLSSPESLAVSPSRINGDGDNDGHEDHESVKMEVIWRPW